MNIDDWIEIAEREVDHRVSSARIAAINGDGRAESEEVSWEIKWRIMCGYLYELKARRETEANLLNNIPMSVLYSTVVTAGGTASLPALYAAVVGSNVGAFFTPMGALAGIMWMTLLKQHKVKFTFGRFVLYGAAVSVPTLLAALGGLLLMV